MLVLTRKTGDCILIADDIEITVISVRGDQVRLGITAPRHVAIRRRELLDRVREENLAAARAASLNPPRETPSRAVALPRPLKCGRASADTKTGEPLDGRTNPHRERRPTTH